MRYRITPLARQDLSEIWEYSERTWGTAQAEAYLRDLERSFGTIARGQGIGRLRPDLGPDIRALPVNRHMVFYLPREREVAILRVLHHRRDFSVIEFGEDG
jgi:toxin ParE1/3/4